MNAEERELYLNDRCAKCENVNIRSISEESVELLHKLYSTNECPHDSDVSRIQDCRDTLLEHERTVDEEIERSQQPINSILRHRQNIHREVDRTNAVLSSVRRIPPEILTEIIGYSLYPSPYESMFLTGSRFCSSVRDVCSFDRKHMLWTIPLVCQYWRSAAIGLPHLWSSFDFIYTHHALENLAETPAWETLFNLQIQRSMSVPLTITIIFPPSPYNAHMIYPQIRRITSVILPYLSRSRALYLTCSGEWFRTDIIPALILSPHSLDVFGLVCWHARGYCLRKLLESVSMSNLQTLWMDPDDLLKTLQWTDCSPTFSFREYCCPVIHTSEISSFLRILKQFPDLERCCFSCYHSSDEEPYIAVRHLRLHTLSICGNGGSGSILFPSLTLPLLQHLKFRGSIRAYSFKQFVQQSKCSLRTFDIGIDGDDADFELSEDPLDLIRALPSSVEELKMYWKKRRL